MPPVVQGSSRTRGALLAGVFTVIVGAVFAFAWVADEMLEGDTRAFDDAVRAWAHALASPAMTSGMLAISRLGSFAVLTIAGVVVAGVSLYRRRNRDALLIGVVLVGSSVLEGTLKIAFQRTRPNGYFGASPTTFSFPSGHAMGALCFYGALALIISSHIRGRAAAIAIWTTAATIVVLVGFSRIYLGVHYPSDVVAGYTMAGAWLWAVAFLEWYGRPHSAPADDGATVRASAHGP